MTGMRVMPITTVSGPASRDEGVVMPWLMWWSGLAESSSPLITATGPANTRHIHQTRDGNGDTKAPLIVNCCGSAILLSHPMMMKETYLTFSLLVPKYQTDNSTGVKVTTGGNAAEVNPARSHPCAGTWQSSHSGACTLCCYELDKIPSLHKRNITPKIICSAPNPHSYICCSAHHQPCLHSSSPTLPCTQSPLIGMIPTGIHDVLQQILLSSCPAHTQEPEPEPSTTHQLLSQVGPPASQHPLPAPTEHKHLHHKVKPFNPRCSLWCCINVRC